MVLRTRTKSGSRKCPNYMSSSMTGDAERHLPNSSLDGQRRRHYYKHSNLSLQICRRSLLVKRPRLQRRLKRPELS
eukprot:scaffold261_cov169-Ochromonas_danica.AAC.5